MVKVELSARAQKVYVLLHHGEQFIRQQTLAEQLGCSRRTVGRALQELKAACLLFELKQRHSNRCKMYEVKASSVPESEPLTLHAQLQWERYEKTFRIVFGQKSDLEHQYALATRKLKDIRGETELWQATWAALRTVYEESKMQTLGI